MKLTTYDSVKRVDGMMKGGADGRIYAAKRSGLVKSRVVHAARETTR